MPGTSSAYAERVVGGYYLEIIPDRDRLARYGLMVADVQERGRDGARRRADHHHRRGPRTLHRRHPLSARPALRPAGDRQGRAGRRCPAAAPCRSARWPTFGSTQGATSIRTENAKLATYIFVDIRDRDLGGYVAEAKKAVAEQVKLPAGTYLVWSGQFEYLERAEARLQAGRAGDADDHLPAALPQLPPHHRDADRHAVAAVRAGRRLLADVVARLQHVGRGRGRLHRARRRRRRDRRRHADLPRPRRRGDPRALPPPKDGPSHAADLYDAIMIGAVERVRPKMMTVVAIMAGLLPIMWSTGTGSEVMQRIAVPMIGGMVSSTLLTLIVIPAVYALVKGWRLPKLPGRAPRTGGVSGGVASAGCAAVGVVMG